MGDGYCDDSMNNKLCQYDGGDCCLSEIKTEHCSECLCLEEETITTTPSTTTTSTASTNANTTFTDPCKEILIIYLFRLKTTLDTSKFKTLYLVVEMTLLILFQNEVIWIIFVCHYSIMYMLTKVSYLFHYDSLLNF